MQCIVDGAIIAAEQVQGIRLDIQEKGKSVAATDLLLDGLVTLSLGTVAGPLLTVATKHIFGPMIRAAAIAVRLPGVAETSAIRGEAARNLWLARRIAGPAAKLTRARARELEQEVRADQLVDYHKWIRAIARGDPKVVDSLKETVRYVAQDVKSTNTVQLAAKDTPGAAVVSAAMSYASSNRCAIDVVREHLIYGARAAGNEQATLRQLHEAAAVPELALDLSAFRRRYSMLFEAAIWSLLHEIGAGQANKLQTRKLLDDAKIEGISPGLQLYLNERFGQAIQETALHDRRYNEIKAGWAAVPYNQKVAHVYTHLTSVRQDTPELATGAFELTKA